MMLNICLGLSDSGYRNLLSEVFKAEATVIFFF